MYKNYLISAIRFLSRNKTFFAINLLGLAFGMASVIIISIWISSELSYNKFHRKAENIYRLNSKLIMAGEEKLHPTHHAPIGEMVAEKFPEIECMTRFSRGHSRIFKHKDGNIMVEDIHYVDSTFFKIFSFELTAGNPNTALNQPHTIIITQSTADKFFGKNSAVGQTLESEGIMYTVTGVLKDPPVTSSLKFNMLEPMVTANKDFGGFSWGHGMGFQTWILLKSGTNIKLLEEKIAGLMDDTVNELFKSINARIYGFFEPLSDIYLNSKVERQQVRGDKRAIQLFTISALLILLIACFNFINLSTTKSLLRAREVGVRKVFGASKKQLIIQHLGESMLLILLAFVLAFIIIELSFPFIEMALGKPLELYGSNARFLLVFIPLLILVTGIGAGWYPSLYLSRFNPITIFKQKENGKSSKMKFKTTLTFLQFTILQALAICTAIIFLQLQHFKSANLGYNAEGLVIAPLNSPELKAKANTLKQKASEKPNVTSATRHSFLLGHSILIRDFVLEGSTEAHNIAYITIDDNFFNTYGIILKEGRSFLSPIENEGNSVIVNEAFVRQFGYNNPIGRKIFLPNNPQHTVNKIVGVVKDFNYLSLHRGVEPLVMLTWHDPFDLITFRVNPDNLPAAITEITQAWKELANDQPINYFFMEDKQNELYVKEWRFGNIFGIFTLLAITIACAGLFGLTAHEAEGKQREIAIRKVLGAPTLLLANKFTLGFTKWIALSSLIAWPLAWITMSRWLNSFEYRIDMPFWVFYSTTAIALLIAIITTLSITLRVSTKNPSTVLKYE